MEGVDKYHALFGLNLKALIKMRMADWPGIPIIFENDAACFGSGMSYADAVTSYRNAVCITLGTGLGAAFVSDHELIREGKKVPPGGYLYNTSLHEQTAEDYISSRWLLKAYNEAVKGIESDDPNGAAGKISSLSVTSVKEIADLAFAVNGHPGETQAKEVFRAFGKNLGLCLAPWLVSFQADCLVLGGGIAGSAELFMPALRAHLSAAGVAATVSNIPIIISKNIEQAAISGAVKMIANMRESNSEKEKSDSVKNGVNLENETNSAEEKLAGSTQYQAFENQKPRPARSEPEFQIASLMDASDAPKSWRKSHQKVLPEYEKDTVLDTDSEGVYNIYPYKSIGAGKIQGGYEGLAGWIKTHKAVAIDGYVGNDWQLIQGHLAAAFKAQNTEVIWCEMSAFVKPAAELNALVQPFLGGLNGTEPLSVWGTKSTLTLADFYDLDKLNAVRVPAMEESATVPVFILYGIGSGLYSGQNSSSQDSNLPILYIDLPKNEIQYRLKAGSVLNLWSDEVTDYAMMYKRSFFVDWVLLDRHRQTIKDRISIVADGQWYDTIHWLHYKDLGSGLGMLARGPIRPRPWFAAGAWGGDWMSTHFPQLSKKEVNYAWSFELIAPENGLVFESDGLLLEVAFDWLMEQESEKVLGAADAARFGSFFPIRFDFLDTYNGGNLSIQCHPSVSYIQQHFGEQITQDETYYILDCKKDAGVYLGFQEDIEPVTFRKALQDSFDKAVPVQIEKYVQFLPSEKHGLYLIPNGTVHSAAENNLVLEISATPYIFTFKMYDWLRPDLNGKPRPINIEHAFNNLNFDRKGAQVQRELVSVPTVLEQHTGFKIIHLPTHKAHFYDVHRIEFDNEADLDTRGKCHLMMLVEGQSISVQLPDGSNTTYQYAETFVLPAAVGPYKLINTGEPGQPVKVIKAFVK